MAQISFRPNLKVPQYMIIFHRRSLHFDTLMIVASLPDIVRVDRAIIPRSSRPGLLLRQYESHQIPTSLRECLFCTFPLEVIIFPRLQYLLTQDQKHCLD